MKTFWALRSKKTRAVSIMSALCIEKDVVGHFLDDGTLYCSFYDGNKNTVTLSRQIDQTILDAVRSFEKNNGCLVYHIVQPDSNSQSTWFFLYVPKRSARASFEFDLQYRFVDCCRYMIYYPDSPYSSQIRVKEYMGGLIKE